MEKHSSVPSVYYRDAVGLLLVYDVSQPKSQDSVKRWWKDASTTVMMKDGRPLPTVLLANKVAYVDRKIGHPLHPYCRVPHFHIFPQRVTVSLNPYSCGSVFERKKNRNQR